MENGFLETDINTYAGAVGSSFHNCTIEVDVCGKSYQPETYKDEKNLENYS